MYMIGTRCVVYDDGVKVHDRHTLCGVCDDGVKVHDRHTLCGVCYDAAWCML
jgi:hypothetical protein